MPRHVSVLVEGKFSQSPGAVAFALGGKTFHDAEPTAKDFVIGQSVVKYGINPLKDWLVMQNPFTGQEIYNPETTNWKKDDSHR